MKIYINHPHTTLPSSFLQNGVTKFQAVSEEFGNKGFLQFSRNKLARLGGAVDV